MVKDEDLITYCGFYGGNCARWCGYTKFRDLVALLAEWVDAQGYQHWMPQELHEFDYREFRKGLDFFSKPDTWLVCHRCCKGGDGNPDCEIRKCCRERGLEICFDCDEFPCERVGEDPGMMERSRQYRALGKTEWLRQQVEKANRGFEGHTRKYYQMRATEDPPQT
ncbi:MAG: DUF3795 domain-containing protein [Chloroflexi bacterium]|nr:DUF3795 domain-containing protein [Chloroflexota bacterium]